ncbi:MAG: hypothetical protein IPP28_00135 [Xanthomonadales bacterium]|nr:hypothetical protein [Xanthomonadales bacterium]
MPPQQHYVSTVRQSGQHLLRMVNDLLDLSRAEAGKLSASASDGVAQPAARKSSMRSRRWRSARDSNARSRSPTTCRRACWRTRRGCARSC